VIRDLGALTGPLLAFGGPVSNLQATRALIGAAAARGIAPGNCLCTGDTAAYCGQPAETVAALRRFGCPVLAGNCERQLAEGAAGCGCGFAPGSLCDRLSAPWYAHAAAALPGAARDWMAGLPDMLVFTHEGRRGAAIHGGATDIARFVWPDAPETVFAEEVAAIRAAAGPVELVIAGHCGLGFVRQVAGVLWVNAGAIGMPANDGRAETRFAVLEAGTARLERLAYDHAAAAAAMQRAGLVQGYQRTLASGVWPSQEILPPGLRRPA
jgi:predicted phosphodiesterase